MSVKMEEQQESIYIDLLEVENTMRVKAGRFRLPRFGMTILGGLSDQGKSSFLSAAAWLFGGAKFKPSNAHRDGALGDPHMRAVLSNGIIVERKGKSAALTVTDPSGQKHGQALLDSFISELALDVSKFLNATSKERTQILLQIIGVGDDLARLEEAENRLYNERRAIGQIADAKAKHAQELPEYADAPAESVSVAELVQQQQSILARNGANQQLRNQVTQLIARAETQHARVVDLEAQLARAQAEYGATRSDLETAQRSAQDLSDESTAEIEDSIANIESINAQVAANHAKATAQDEADTYRAQYDAKTAEIDQVRADRMALLDSAKMPLPEMTLESGEILYNGKAWDCMAESQKLKVATAIPRSLKPQCGFVFVDGLEKMDTRTLGEFNDWLLGERLQLFGTRVSTGEECSIIIEDGLPAGETYADVVTGVSATKISDNQKEWGEF